MSIIVGVKMSANATPSGDYTQPDPSLYDIV